MPDDESIGTQLASETAAYIDQTETCVGLLPKLLKQYRTDGAYHETVDRIQSLESVCDRHNRRLSALVTNATARDLGLKNSRIHITTPQLVRLYQRVDDVPNAVEESAEALVTIEPPHDDTCFRTFHEMASLASRSATMLAAALSRFIYVLATPAESVAIANEIERVREFESRCDALRNEVIATAFRSESIANPLVYRELALCFDAVADAIEDVGDQLVLLSSTESWIVTE